MVAPDSLCCHLTAVQQEALKVLHRGLEHEIFLREVIDFVA